MNATWSDILQILRGNLAEGVIKVWLEPLVGTLMNHAEFASEIVLGADKSLTNSWILYLQAPNEFAATWVRDKLSQPILQTAETLLGCKPGLQITAESLADKSNALFPPPTTISELKVKSLPTAPVVWASTEHLRLPMEHPRPEPKSPIILPGWKHSFDDFVVGPCNQLAHAAARNMLQATVPVDMLFLCSASGLGKTHLTHAVGRALCHEAQTNFNRLEYITAEEFTSRFVMASKNGTMENFKQHFRNLDMLLLEDVHFLRGKDKTQEELLTTIKVLHAHGGKVVLTSSFAPRDLAGVDSHLVSRFCSGFVASIDQPCKDTRLGILAHKARNLSVILPDQVAHLLAERVTSDVRLLESCLNNLVLTSRMLGRPVNEDMAMEIIHSVAQRHSSLTLEQILSLVCQSFNLTSSQLSSRSRRQDLVIARNTAFFLLRKHTDMTLSDIGMHFNRRHSSVLKGITQFEREISRQSATGRQLQHAVTMIEKNAACA